MQGRVTIVCALTVLAVGVAIYAGSFDGPFIYDDLPSIVENPAIRELWPPRYLVSAPAQSTLASRPVVGASLALNYAAGAERVRGYHVVNLAIHLGCALLLLGLVRRTLLQPSLPAWLREASTPIALATALLWVAHPLQTEAVVYLIQRTETLMALFFLLTLYAAARAWSASGESAVRVWQVICVAACALGMACKEVMVVAPLVVLLYDRAFVSGSFRRAWREHRGLYLSLASTWALLLLLVWTGDRGASAGAHLGISPWSYLLTQAGVIVRYLRLVFRPHPLVVSYEDWPIAGGLLEVAGPVLLVLTLFAVTVWALVKRPRLGFLGAFFFLVLAPTSSFLPIATEPAAERRMYLPLAALLLLMLLALHWLVRRQGRVGRTVLVLFVLAVVAVAGRASVLRVQDYRTELAIWQDCVDKRPQNAAARNNLGQALLLAGRAEEAALEFEQAIRIQPAKAEAYSNLAGLMAQAGRLEEASDLLERALTLQPDRPAKIRNNLGIVLARRGDPEAARRQFEQAVDDVVYAPDAHYNLGLLEVWGGNLPRAIERFETAFALAPSRRDVALALGQALCGAGRFEEASELEQRLRSRGDSETANRVAEQIRQAGSVR